MKFRVEHSLPLAALILLAGCGGGARPVSAPAQQSPYGPAGDYPVVIGPAYEVGGVSYSPSDTMNYDVVGRASLGGEGGAGITAAHHTLPLPSYIEVTALDTGKTVLVRVERRGPMTSNNIVELSPGAAAQLGISADSSAAVRVRRVNPIEPERAMLRAGQGAPSRMDTPKSLLSVLQRKLDAQEGVARPISEVVPTGAPPAESAPLPSAKPKVAAKPKAEPKPKPDPKAKPAVKPAPVAKPGATSGATAPSTASASSQVATKPATAPTGKGRLVIQVGAFANQANAKAAAAKTGGSVSQSGKLWRVQVGPYSSEADARPALAKVRAAGYSDARIQSVK